MEWSPPRATNGRPTSRKADSMAAKSPSDSVSARSPRSSMRPPRSTPSSENMFPAGLSSTARIAGGAVADPRRNDELRSVGTPTSANPPSGRATRLHRRGGAGLAPDGDGGRAEEHPAHDREVDPDR